jgi:hypothetical protein
MPRHPYNISRVGKVALPLMLVYVWAVSHFDPYGCVLRADALLVYNVLGFPAYQIIAGFVGGASHIRGLYAAGVIGSFVAGLLNIYLWAWLIVTIFRRRRTTAGSAKPQAA